MTKSRQHEIDQINKFESIQMRIDVLLMDWEAQSSDQHAENRKALESLYAQREAIPRQYWRF